MFSIFSSKKPIILAIDDQASVRRLIKMTLEKVDCELHFAENGHEGLKLAKKKKPDLILLDEMMPDIDGLEVCKTLKAEDKFSKTKIIFLSAKDEESDKELAFKAGAVDFLRKPFSPTYLKNTVESYLNEDIE